MAPPELPSTMKAFQLEAFNTPYVLRDVPLPSIDGPDDMIVRVDAASYCHTDAVIAAGTALKPELPHVGSHEFAGTIVALAPDSSHRYRVGDRVAVPGRGYHVCGKCLECQHPSGPLPDEPGYSVYCPLSGPGLGVGKPGGFREYAVVDAKQVEKIPDGLTAVEVAPLMCAGLTIYAALQKCHLQAGQRVGIVGCGGGLGHLGLQFAAKMGLKTTGVDLAPRALQLAESLGTGATVVDASKVSAKQARQKMGEEDGRPNPSEMGLDAVVVLPESQTSFDYGLELLRDGGLVMVVSFPPDGFHVPAHALVFRRVRVEGSLIGSNRAMRDMFEFCVRHDVKARIKTYPLSKLNELVEDYHSGLPGKLVVDMSLKE
jgi:propanol-preferring alcohol dehydrogenase